MNLFFCIHLTLSILIDILLSVLYHNAVVMDLCDQAGALMIVGVLATRASLAPKLVQNLIFFVARTARHDASESVDLPWLRVAVMAIISLVQVWAFNYLPYISLTKAAILCEY